MAYRYKRTRKGRGRTPKTVNVAKRVGTEGLAPISKTTRPLYTSSTRTIYVNSAEIEAQRLVDLEGLSQEQAGQRMGVSRGTVWRLLNTARKKYAQSLVEGRTLLVLNEETRQNLGEAQAKP